jgi:hypothetical protein
MIRFFVMAGQKREARLRARCPGHPRLSCRRRYKTWMPGTSPGMTNSTTKPDFIGGIFRTEHFHEDACPDSRLARFTPKV